MNHAKSGFLMLIASVWVLYGCAYTTDYVKLDFTPTNYPGPSKSRAVIQMDRLRDARGVDPTVK